MITMSPRRPVSHRKTGGRLGRVLVAGLTGLLLLPLSAPPAGAAVCPAPGGAAIPAAATPAGADVVVRGGGWGHSLGMSQYGAQGAALLGCNHEQILRAYYTGADVASAPMGPAVLVTLLAGGTGATVDAVSGSVTWRDVAGRRTVSQPVGQSWTVTRTASGQMLRDAAGTDRLWVAQGSELRSEQFGSVARVRTRSGSATVTDLRMRWDYTRFVSDSAGLDVWQVIQDDARGLGVQKYLWSLAEVPVSWPAEALRAQAVAARTYLARRWSVSSGAYVIGTTTATQNWTGYAQEQADAAAGGAWRRAVDATPNRVVTHGGALIDALYSSSHGGSSEDSRYVWRSDVPYLRPVNDSRWDLASSNPYRSWAKGFTNEQLAAAFGVDRVTSISVPGRGSPARLNGVVVTGTDGGAAFSRTYTGFDVRTRLGLRSPGITGVAVVDPGVPLVGDWNGDGVDDLGWFRDGVFTTRDAAGATTSFGFGSASDRAVVGDWNGDGTDGIGIFRDGWWHLRETASPGPAERVIGFGSRGDRPVVGYWRGGAGAGAGAGIGVVRGNTWMLRSSATSGFEDLRTGFGTASDRPVAGDWNGDGTTTPGVVRGNQWFLADSMTAPVAVASPRFGTAAAVPVPGDWNGDGRTTTGVVMDGNRWHWRDDLLGGNGTGTATFSG